MSTYADTPQAAAELLNHFTKNGRLCSASTAITSLRVIKQDNVNYEQFCDALGNVRYTTVAADDETSERTKTTAAEVYAALCQI